MPEPKAYRPKRPARNVRQNDPCITRSGRLPHTKLAIIKTLDWAEATAAFWIQITRKRNQVKAISLKLNHPRHVQTQPGEDAK